MKDQARFPYERIATEIREKILSGELAPGAKIPSEPALATQYETTRTTARKAIAILKMEGRVESVKGSGTRVRKKPFVRLRSAGSNYRERRATGISNYNAEAAAQGQRGEQQLREVATIEAPPEVATRLRFPDDQNLVIVRRLLFLLNGTPDQTIDSYYPHALAAGTPLAEARRIKGGAHAVIEDPNGPIRKIIRRFVEDLEIRMPTPSEMKALDIPTGVPVARVFTTTYDSDGQPIEVRDALIPGDRHHLSYEIDVPPPPSE